MAKSQKKSNREAKKPKQVKVAAPAAGASPFSTPPGKPNPKTARK
jgi:hypothetical protein